MPVMGMLQGAAVAQTLMVELPLLNIASSMAHKSRKHTPEPISIYVRQLMGGSTPNWHMPEEASGTEAAAVAQW